MHEAIERALRIQRHKMLAVRRQFGIGCDCNSPRDGRPHHWACGVNSRAWSN